ncbi:MAG TPA: sugar transferase, partial [Bryobacterales bacterium]|nr:sugar transferase [Bryobacterales bacterium]
ALERLTCRLADRVFAVSPSVARSAIQAGCAADKIVVAGNGSANGLDPKRFDPRRIAAEHTAGLRRCYQIPEGAPVIGLAGRLAPDKGLAELEAAWQLLRDRFPGAHLLLVGETEPHDPLPAPLLARLRLDPRVHFTGWRRDMPEQYLLMDVCVLASRREGLPYAALEAAAMERPVAGFCVDGVVDAVEHGSTGLLAPAGDVAALAAAIAGLLEDPGLARRLGQAGRARAERLYRREPLWEILYQQYREALLERAGSGALAARRWWKRPLDLVAASLLLPLLAPLLLVIALSVWLDLGRPVLYRQRRPGWRERRFDILKFRTMRSAGGQDRDRLTPLGRFLRRTSLDEFPQLFNILRGEMSFIGPRPLLERYLPYYTAGERRRHLVRPGLAGWAQLHGRNHLPWRERLALDVWYVDHASLGLDARIALGSLWMILAGQGVEEDPSSVMPDLDAERMSA